MPCNTSNRATHPAQRLAAPARNRAGRAQAFDDLLLLKRGGRTIYCGPLDACSADMVAYFQVRAQSRACRPPPPCSQPCVVPLLQRARMPGRKSPRLHGTSCMLAATWRMTLCVLGDNGARAHFICGGV